MGEKGYLLGAKKKGVTPLQRYSEDFASYTLRKVLYLYI